LELVEADLECAEHWPKAVAGCSAIPHVASPWPIVADEGTIRTAVEGTMNVLRAAAECREVRKVVMTSSCAAIMVVGIKGLLSISFCKRWPSQP